MVKVLVRKTIAIGAQKGQSGEVAAVNVALRLRISAIDRPPNHWGHLRAPSEGVPGVDQTNSAAPAAGTEIT